jgi:hypothetical protein
LEKGRAEEALALDRRSAGSHTVQSASRKPAETGVEWIALAKKGADRRCAAAARHPSREEARVRNLLLLRHRSPPLEDVAADEEATNPPTVADADEPCGPPTAEDWLAAGAFLREETVVDSDRGSAA